MNENDKEDSKNHTSGTTTILSPLTHTHAYNPHPLYIVTCDRRGDLDEFFLYILCSFIFKHITDYTDNAYLLFF